MKSTKEICQNETWMVGRIEPRKRRLSALLEGSGVNRFSAEAEILSPLPEPEEQKRETTFPMANGNGLRTQPTGAGPIIEIPAAGADSGAPVSEVCTLDQ